MRGSMGLAIPQLALATAPALTTPGLVSTPPLTPRPAPQPAVHRSGSPHPSSPCSLQCAHM